MTTEVHLAAGHGNTSEHRTPSDIERTSLGIIERELAELGIVIPEQNTAVVHRVVHATADFEYARNLFISEDAVKRAVKSLAEGVDIITDTNMALAGVGKTALAKLGGSAHCFMAEPSVYEEAKKNGTTRAYAAMTYAAANFPKAVFAVGNAPTALFSLAREIENGFRPSLIIAAPVGFVNVVEAKEEIVGICGKYDIPVIAAMGRKGGSSVAAAICNAVLYTAADQLDPAARGWN